MIKNCRKKYCNGSAPSPTDIHPEDTELQTWVVDTILQMFHKIDLETIPSYARTVAEIGSRLNVFFTTCKPWKLIKDPDQRPRFDSLLYTYLDCLRLLFEFAYPIMPDTGRFVKRT